MNSDAEELLKDLLRNEPQTPDLASLRTREPDVELGMALCKRVNGLLADRHWSGSRQRQALEVLRDRCGNTEWLRRVFVLLKPKTTRSKRSSRVLFESWLKLLQAKFPEQAKTALSFYKRQVLPFLKLDLSLVSEPEMAARVQEKLQDKAVLANVVGRGKLGATKLQWLQFFFDGILHVPVTLDPGTLRDLPKPTPKAHPKAPRPPVTPEQLEALWSKAQRDPLDELLFVLLLTTGLNHAAITHLQLARVADLRDKRWHVRAQGESCFRTHYAHAFYLHARAQTLLDLWLNTRRPFVDSPYVFPGPDQDSVMGAELLHRFRNLSRDAGLCEQSPDLMNGCFARILLSHIALEADIPSILAALKQPPDATLPLPAWMRRVEK
jgi:hypothetical protein